MKKVLFFCASLCVAATSGAAVETTSGRFEARAPSRSFLARGSEINLTYFVSTEMQSSLKENGRTFQGRYSTSGVSSMLLPAIGYRYNRLPESGFGFILDARYEPERKFRDFSAEGSSNEKLAFSFLVSEANLAYSLDRGAWFFGLNEPVVITQYGNQKVSSGDPGWQLGAHWKLAERLSFELLWQQVNFSLKSDEGPGWGKIFGLGIRTGYRF